VSEERVAAGVEVGLRRDPSLDPGAPLPESDPRLVERIAAEIREAGPMTFARFMDIALYDPEAGYYTASGDGRARGPGRAADFLTAPESHPIFGWTVARQLEEAWQRLDRPSRFVVREHGAASGALAVGILDGLRRSASPLFEAIRYQPIDVSPGARQAFAATLDGVGLTDRIEAADAGPAAGAVLANELLDALPVHRVEGGPGGELRELFVALAADGSLGTELGEPSTPALAERLAGEAVVLAPGQAAEICLAVDEWLASAVAPLARGLLLVIDYGADATDLYTPARGSTLRAYHRHRVHDDPLVAIGRQDLTAHVDLTAVERAAVAAGLTRLGGTTQASFLANLGIGELLVGLQSDPTTTLETYVAARSALVRMLDPRATGGFAVMAFGRGLATDPPLRGFASPAA
jgi:SAM-dependent MidA family methyltransferase